MVNNYYQILGVHPTVSQDALKKAYRQLAHKYHPDANPNDSTAEAKFKEMQGAYDTLKDPDKRAAYDASFTSARVDDEFFSFFKGQTPAAAIVKLSFTEPLRACKKTFSYQRKINCKKCSGSGVLQFSTLPCSGCQGSGRSRVSANFIFSSAFSVVCKDCKGQGFGPSVFCEVCNSTGSLAESQEVTVTLPAGVMSGQAFRCFGQGHQNNRGTFDDLMVHVQVETHPHLSRQGAQVLSCVPLYYSQIVLGAAVEVESIWGDKLSVNIPPGFDYRTSMRLMGKGFPKLTGLENLEMGDHILEFEIRIPSPISERHRDLLNQLLQEENRV